MAARYKAALRRDGKLRYTLRLDFHLDFEDIAAIVANRCNALGLAVPGTKTGVMREVHYYLHSHGDAGCGVLDYVSDGLHYYVRKTLAPLFQDLNPEVGEPPAGYDEEEVKEQIES